MPIIINPQNCRYTACTTLARTFSYNGLKPHLTGPVTAELKDLKTLLKTPTRVNDIVEVRLYIGPFQSPDDSAEHSVKWKAKNSTLPAIYRKFEFKHKIRLASDTPCVKKIISASKKLATDNIRIVHGRIIITLKLCTTIVYITKK